MPQPTKAQLGDIVTIDGYGGLARVIEIIDAPGGNYQVAMVQFGPYNINRSSKLHEFALSRLVVHKHANGSTPATATEAAIDQMDMAQVLARLAQINAQLAEV